MEKQEPNQKRKKGRPSKYTKELGQLICKRLEEGESLRGICCNDDMPDERAVRSWAADPEHPFSPHYARSREIGYDAMAEELLEIADNGKNDWMLRHGDIEDKQSPYALNGEHIQRSRVRIDTRKWILSKMLPKRYGEKQSVEHSGSITLEQLIAESMKVNDN